MHEGVTTQWLVAHTKPQQERWAAENLRRQGYDYYLPVTLSKTKTSKTPSEVCLFPRYIFVKTTGAWRSLLGTFGLSGVVMTGERPSILPTSVVERLKSCEGKDGIVYLPETPASRWKAGDTLRVTEGPLFGRTAICAEDSGPTRVRILLEFLGSQTSVRVPIDWVTHD